MSTMNAANETNQKAGGSRRSPRGASRKHMKQYRYYSSSLSRHMARSLDKHLAKIGEPTRVEGHYRGGRRNSNPWFFVVIFGTAGKLCLKGCSWGYGGEGPHATKAVLTRLGVHPFDVDTVCFKGPKMPDSFKATREPVWSLALPASGMMVQLDAQAGRYNTAIASSADAKALNHFAERVLKGTDYALTPSLPATASSCVDGSR